MHLAAPTTCPGVTSAQAIYLKFSPAVSVVRVELSPGVDKKHKAREKSEERESGTAGAICVFDRILGGALPLMGKVGGRGSGSEPTLC